MQWGGKKLSTPPKWTMAVSRRKTKYHILVSCMDVSRTGRTAGRVQGRTVKLLPPVLAALARICFPSLICDPLRLLLISVLIHFQAGCLLDCPFVVSCLCGGGSIPLFECLHS